MKYTSIIGLEIHTELKTNSKMFCSCKNDPNEKRPNYNICPICLAHPGTLPVINEEAVKKVIKTGIALNCKIPEKSKFDRKNYFYPDLPKGYQISQYDMPLCQKGYLKIRDKKIRITRVHLEEDTGRLIHPDRADYSLVDFNRAGIPLMELVTEPDINSAKEAKDFSQELQLILRYLGVSEADMEKGQMRVEVNISLTKNKKLGTKVEIKNLNSFRVVERAIEYEIKRQEEVLKKGEKIIQETRGWDDEKGVTFSQRKKEEAHDYRYFPEPDLPTMNFSKEFIRGIETEITELPESKRERFKKEYGLEEEYTEIFVSQKDLSEYFEKTISELPSKISLKEVGSLTKLAANYLITDVKGLLGQKLFSEKDFKITPENFAEFITLIHEGKISSKTAKEILKTMYETGVDPSHIIDEQELFQLTDLSDIEKAIKEVILSSPKPVEDYKKGKEAALQFLVGKVMAQTKGRAKPDAVIKILKKLL